MEALSRHIGRLDALAAKLAPAERAAMMRDIAAALRQSNKARIRANTAPDGAPFVSRKTPAGAPLAGRAQIKPGKLFYYKGRAVEMRTVKTAQSAANPSRPTTKPHDDAYVWGYDRRDGAIKKYRKDQIRLPGNGVRAALMFRKIHQFKYLQQQAGSDQARVGFMRGLAGHIAAAHYHGEATRPVRRLLGFSAADLAEIEALIIRRLAAAAR